MTLLRGSSDDPDNHANPAMLEKDARWIASAIDANWAQYQEHEEAAIPRQTMGEVVLSCVLGEVRACLCARVFIHTHTTNQPSYMHVYIF